ncbi:phosphoribosylformylglycinamidine synthase subunit PurL [Granulicoccus phenolivorans]|uniref:phosphoribosylformylglycinamidine synthase subunit PurL n=1 Tax=Granulicoccus phenolivorans TaxID=266854 RepID=UPI0003F8715B|nr:phosphoribosylformylglycinamidine synthase subunit PurL [Granulicoccus phenolivorans]
MADTVKNAAETPDVVQPWADLGLNPDEYARIRDILKRRPTASELAMYSVMWSEHCSYKSSKVHLRKFGELDQNTPRGPMLAGIGENAGVVDIGHGYAVTFKMESHNHPSYVEPYQGAATGVGGIVRDILAMGARPIGVMDPLRFGPIDGPDTPRVVEGIVAGVGGYGNCLGLPNIGGEVMFDRTYAGNPLVNALCVGVLKHEDLHLAHATGVGNQVILYGAATGGDGIGGVSVLASETFTEGGPTKRPSVQVGDPFMEKLLIECTLELFAEKLVVGIQDLGGGGLSCSTSELASAGDGGMRVELDRVPLRDPSLSPEEILMSESQERMMAVVEPGQVERFMEICRKWDVQATVVGEVTDDDRLVITWHGEVVVDVIPETVAADGPVYQRPYAYPAWMDRVHANDANKLPRDNSPVAITNQLLRLVAAPNLCDKSWVTRQYDRFVRGNSVLAQPEDAGMLRIDPKTNLGIALSTDCNSRMAYLNPYLGAQHALLEAYRNVAVTGAQPVAITDCLNFGSPEDPAIMWQFVEAILGLKDGCAALGLPVTGGNVSFYNQTGDTAILPTPTVGMLGVMDDVTLRIRSGFAETGDEVWLLGETREEMSGTVWADVFHNGHLGGMPPVLDFEHEQRLAAALQQAATQQTLSSAHDLADGGLAQALFESCQQGGFGVEVTLPQGAEPTVALFSESAGRVLVTVRAGASAALTALAKEHRLPLTRLGTVTAGGADATFRVAGLVDLPLSRLREAWQATLPAAMA